MFNFEWSLFEQIIIGPHQANLVLIAYASSEGSGEPAHPRSLARTFAARSYKQWIKRNLQTENQIPGPSKWLDMRSWNLSWRNARRHKFAWRGSYANNKDANQPAHPRNLISVFDIRSADAQYSLQDAYKKKRKKKERERQRKRETHTVQFAKL